jgi:hypothetical protein
VYRCGDCGMRSELDEAGDDAALLVGLLSFLRAHERCALPISLDRLVVLPSPRSAELPSSGFVDGDPLVHAVAASSFLALCSGEVLMSRGSEAFVSGAAGACPRCSAVLQRSAGQRVGQEQAARR